jgi:hypothetical protein
MSTVGVMLLDNLLGEAPRSGHVRDIASTKICHMDPNQMFIDLHGILAQRCSFFMVFLNIP